MTQICSMNLRYLDGYFGFGVTAWYKKRNVETDSYTSYISKVDLPESPYLIFLDYLLIHLIQCDKWFSLSEVEKKRKNIFQLLPWNIGRKSTGYVWFSAWQTTSH